MSDLLNSASLVMIPSGYKEDTVFSAIPSDGSGDLSFTRASNGTRVNSGGLVEVCPWNLLEYSNAFNTAPWSMNVTSGQAGKDGQNNAWLLTKAGASTSDFYNSNVYNGDQTFTIYVKKESGKGFKLFPIGTTTTSTEVNLQTGVVLNQPLNGLTTVEAYSSTWWKISVALNMINSIYYIYVTDGAGTQIASSITIQDAQVNIGLTAKPYFPTTDRLNVPRLTYQNGGGGCPSLLLEKQSTNVLTYSEDFTQSDWPKQNTIVTANATTSPDGTQNADKLIANTTNARHLIFQAIATSNTHTFTTYAKAGENSFLIMRLDTDAPEVKNWFNLSNGTVGTSQGGSPTITSVGNGWYRCSMQYTPSTLSNIYAVLYTAKTDGVEGFAGNDSDGTYIWGAQLEASTYPTSYIPTTNASATRVADACFKTGISSLIGQTEGVMFVDFELKAYDSLAKWIAFLGSGSYYIGLYTDGNSRFVAEVYDGAIQFVNQTFTFSVGQRYKIAIAYKANDFAFYINGTQIATDSSGTVPTTSAFSFEYNSTAAQLTTRIYNQSALFKNRLTNAELASLTTI
jgi:hypothetical protein